MNEWKLPWSGGCRCGLTRIRVVAPPLMASACHCAGCQRMTSSAFSLTLTVPVDGFEVTAGEPVIGGLHGPSRHCFCPRCLTWMFTRPEGMEEFVNVRASMLDDHGWFVPHIEVWRSEGFPWAGTPAVKSYATEPEEEEYSALVEQYARTGARPA